MKRDSDSNLSSEGAPLLPFFDEYMARLNSDIPRDLVRRMRSRWRIENRRLLNNSVSSVQADPTPNQSNNRGSFSEYYASSVRRAIEITGEDPSSVTHVVAKHWKSGEWNDPSGSGRQGD